MTIGNKEKLYNEAAKSIYIYRKNSYKKIKYHAEKGNEKLFVITSHLNHFSVRRGIILNQFRFAIEYPDFADRILF